MKLLFLDTETSGVNPAKDQVIEIGGVVCEFDTATLEMLEIDEFESTVALRMELEDKITRITGITKEELATAPNQKIVQENWANWLEKHKIDAIVGHSIQFDIDFLNSESWFLPEKYKVIDTLDLSRVFFPHLHAINLEFLCEKLNLVDFVIKNSYHRSLFDTKACIRLLRKIFLEMKNYQLSVDFVTVLKKEFLPLDINFFNSLKQKETDAKTSQEKDVTLKKEITLSGEIRPENLSQSLNQLGKQVFEDRILELFKLKLPRDLTLILLQVYFINTLKLYHADWQTKLHFKNNLCDIWFAEIILEIVQKNQETSIEDKNVIYYLPRFERIIWNIKSAAEETVELGKLSELINFYFQMASDRPEEFDNDYLKELQLCVSGYEFFVMVLQSFFANGRYLYNPQNIIPQERDLAARIVLLLARIKKTIQLITEYPVSKNVVIKNIANKIQILGKKLDFQPNTKLNFYLNQNVLVMSVDKPNFSLQGFLNELEVKYPNFEVTTLLNKSDFCRLLEMADIQDFEAFEYGQKVDFDLIDRTKLDDFYNDAINKAKQENKPILVLAGQNSTIKDSKKILTENHDIKDYLLVGETGSLTKITSKLVRDFCGVVVLKSNSLDFVIHTPNLPEFAEIWLVNPPYLFLHSFWYNRSNQSGNKEQFMVYFKSLYIQTIASYIFTKTGKVVKFLRAY